MERKEQSEQSLKAVGNTKATAYKARKYCYTLNNYTETEVDAIQKWCEMNCIYFVIGKENGGTNGTPHLQGFLEFKNPRSFNTIKKLMPRAHIEAAKGTRKQNIKYCSKEKVYAKTLTFKERIQKQCLDEFKTIEWKNWQQSILDLCKTTPNNRTINWYWESKGNTGKSFLAKYICLIHECVIAEGKKNDVFNQVNTMLENEILPTIVILDIPRFNNFTNYGVLEQLKNGLMYSGKYEGGQCVFPSPHLIIFANDKPDESMMSKDRWNIVHIGN